MKKLAINGGPKTIENSHAFKWPNVSQDIIDAVTEYLRNEPISIYDRSGIYSRLEDKFAKYHDAKYAILTNSGTTALHSAFFAAGIKAGDEVIAPTYTFLATVTPIIHCFATPILVDAQPDTGNIDPEEIRKEITKKTKAIVINHNWGHPVDLEEIIKIKEEFNLKLIEDCSHAHGATYKGRKVGTFGDAACFSLQANKAVFSGEGGILITNDKEIYEKATLLGHYRARSEQCVEDDFLKQFSETGYGLKYRIHPLGAVIADKSFDKLEEVIALRKEKLNYLSEKLKGIKGISPPITRDYVTRGAFYGYKPFFKPEELNNISREDYVKALQAEGLDVTIPGSKPLHMLPLFQQKNTGFYDDFIKRKTYKNGDFPNAEKYWNNILSLPTFTYESYELIDKYVEGFKKVADNINELVK